MSDTVPTIPFSVRLTEYEHAELKEAAVGSSMAKVARARMFDGETKRRKPRRQNPVIDRDIAGQLLGKLGRSGISHSLKQMAEAAEAGYLIVDPETKSKLLEAFSNIKAMRDDLIRAQGLKITEEPEGLHIKFNKRA